VEVAPGGRAGPVDGGAALASGSITSRRAASDESERVH